MEYPYGHTHTHHQTHHRRKDDDDYVQPLPPNQPASGAAYPHAPPPEAHPPYGGAYQHPPPPEAYPPMESYPPPPVSGVYHESPGYYPPAPAPIAGVVSHSHHGGGGGGGAHHFQPHMPGFIEGHFNGHHSENKHVSESEGGDYLSGYFDKKPTFRVFCKAGGDRYTIAVRDGKMVLAQHNPDDLTQHWYKDEKWSTKVKDEEGYPSFALANKATGEAVKHSVAGHPVKLISFKPKEFDESILWTESKDLGQGFRTIRIVNNVKLCMDAFHGDDDHGGVHDGTQIALYDCWQGDNQQWKIVPYSY